MSSQSAIDVVKDWGQGMLEASHDLGHVLRQPFKIAALPVFYNQPGYWAYDAAVSDLDLAQFDLVLFSDPEYAPLQQIRSWAPSCNWILAFGGIRSDETADSSREIYRPYYIRDFLAQNQWQDTGSCDKPFLFDALLGSRRPHRDFVFHALAVSGLDARSILTYRTQWPGALTDSLTQQVSDFFGRSLQVPYVSDNLDPEWEVSPALEHWHSRLSPVNIYRRTWFSILCETLHTGDHFFLSEKTIKAMFNRRIFVMFGACGYLENLRRQGFRTFDCIMDESYDQEPRDLRRWQQAMHTVWQLAWFEQPAEIYESYSWLLTHNQQHLEWLEQKRCQDLYELMLRTIPADHWYTV